jgi:hypothetical protein
MIDSDDGDFFLLSSSSASGWVAVVFIGIAIIFYMMAASYESDCLEKSCASGAPKYVDGECLCASAPK